MIKHPKAQKTFKIHPSVTSMHKDMMTRFIVERGFLSESDVVRQAIVFFHDKHFPPYVYRETAAGQKKLAAITEEKVLAEISETEYAKTVLKGYVMPHENGEAYVVMHGFFNSIIAYPLKGIKELIKKDPAILEQHLNELKNHPIDYQLTHYGISYLRSEYGIVVPEEYKNKAS